MALSYNFYIHATIYRKRIKVFFYDDGTHFFMFKLFFCPLYYLRFHKVCTHKRKTFSFFILFHWLCHHQHEYTHRSKGKYVGLRLTKSTSTRFEWILINAMCSQLSERKFTSLNMRTMAMQLQLVQGWTFVYITWHMLSLFYIWCVLIYK